MAWSLFAVGGTYGWTLAPTAAAALAMAAVARPRVPGPGDTRRLDTLLLLTLAAVAVTLVPLPSAVRGWLSPRHDALQASLVLAPASAPGLHPLALDPGSAGRAALGLAASALTFWGSRHLFGRRGSRRVVRGIAIVGLLATITAVIQHAVDPARIYGVWTPLDRGARPFGPFVNRNHFATWPIMAMPLAMGYALAEIAPERTTRTARARLASLLQGLGTSVTWVTVAAGVLGLGIVVSASRSGILASLAAVSTLAVIGGPRAGRRVRAWGIAGFALLAAGIAAYASLAPLLARAEETLAVGAGDRPRIWFDAWRIASDFWVAGVGPGGFPRAMLLYQQSGRALFANQAHNQYLQILAEGGLLVTVPAVLTAAAFVRLAMARLEADVTPLVWIRIGAAAGVTGVALQSVWETGLRMPANSILFAVVAAIAVHRPAVPRRSAGPVETAEDGLGEPGLLPETPADVTGLAGRTVGTHEHDGQLTATRGLLEHG